MLIKLLVAIIFAILLIELITAALYYSVIVLGLFCAFKILDRLA